LIRREDKKKAGVDPEGHATIHMVDNPPPKEDEKISDFTNDPIQVKLITARDKLDSNSIVDFTRLYTVEHNLKVYFIGELTSSSRREALAAVNAARKRMMQAN
jgi:hypothetical protein